MTTIISIIRFILFFATVVGYILFILDKTKMQIEFAPIVVFSIITVLMFLAGLLNVMLYAAGTIVLLGVILFVNFTIKKKLSPFFQKRNVNIGTLFIIIAFIYFTLFLQGTKFIYYDDFSHWGVVVKDMLFFDRLPNLQYNPGYGFITFTSYPPGSSLFVYFVSKIIGYSESKMMIAQIYLMLACLFAFFGISKDKKYTSVIVIFASLFMLIGRLGFNTLMVDTLLPLVGFAGTVIIYYYRTDVKKASLFVLPVNIMLILVKNSGIFFVIVNGLLLLYYAIKARKNEVTKQDKSLNFVFVSGFILITFFMLFLWKQHLDYVFPGKTSLHTISLKNFSTIFGAKTKEQILQIIKIFLTKTISLRENVTQSIFIANIGSIILIVTDKMAFKKTMKGLLTALLCADGLFLLYQVGNLGMYLFSMPIGEALSLAGYYRYVSTINIYFIGVLVIGFIHDFEIVGNTQAYTRTRPDQTKFESHSFKLICTGLMLSTILLSGNASINSSYDMLYQKRYYPATVHNYPATVPGKFDSIKQENNDGYSTTHYLVYAPGELNSYVAFVVKYKTFSLGVKVIDTLITETEFLELASKYYFFVVLEEDEQIVKLLSQYIDRGNYVGIYQSAELFSKKIK